MLLVFPGGAADSPVVRVAEYADFRRRALFRHRLFAGRTVRATNLRPATAVRQSSAGQLLHGRSCRSPNILWLVPDPGLRSAVAWMQRSGIRVALRRRRYALNRV